MIGVETVESTQTNAPVAYHFFTRNPQDYLARNRWRSVPSVSF